MKAPLESCSRDKSRKVRTILRELVLSQLGSEFELPDDCPLDPELDSQLPHEELKRSMAGTDWGCGACGKHFRSEEFVDKHMFRKHPELIDQDRTVCLADMCDVFLCDELATRFKRQKFDDDENDDDSGISDDQLVQQIAKSKCDELKMKSLKHRCQALVTRCFPPDMNPEAHRLSNLFSHQLCSHFSCDFKGKRPIDLIGKNGKRKVDDKDDSGSRILLWVLGICVLIFCAAVLLHHWETLPTKDLRFLNLGGRRSRLYKVKGF